LPTAYPARCDGHHKEVDCKRPTRQLNEHIEEARPLSRAEAGAEPLAMFQISGVFAELERAITQERIRSGLARARAEGKHIGRPPLKPVLQDRIREALTGGMSIRKTAAKFGVNPSTVQRISAAPFAGADVSASA
jgi:DNA invertase Pin-like site-specific DNA recombinase